MQKLSLMLDIAIAAVAVGLLVLPACSQTQVQQTAATVTTACALAPVLDASSAPQVRADIAQACTDEQVLAPVVTPLIVPPDTVPAAPATP